MLDVIFGVAGVLGFFLSLFLAVNSAVKRRESYSVDVIDYCVPRAGVTQFLVCIQNMSDSPLSIICVTYDGMPCELERKKIRVVEGRSNFQTTPDFPLCISGHGAVYSYLEFVDYEREHKPLSPGITVTFEIQSTRHRKQKTLSLHDTSHYLHTRIQPQTVQALY